MADDMGTSSSCSISAPVRTWIRSVSGTTASTALRNCWSDWPAASPMGASPCQNEGSRVAVNFEMIEQQFHEIFGFIQQDLCRIVQVEPGVNYAAAALIT